MQKDFDTWNINKKRIHNEGQNKFYHTREVWWCSLGMNVGFEEDGTGTEYERPVLILKGFSKNTCLVIPLTTSLKKHPLRIPLGMVDGKYASAILSQMRIIDTKRLIDKIGFIEKQIFEEICTLHDLTPSQVVRQMIRDYVQQYGTPEQIARMPLNVKVNRQ